MQEYVSSIVSSNRSFADLRISFVDLRTPNVPKYAGYKDRVQTGVASMMKIGILYASYQLRDAVRRAAPLTSARTDRELFEQLERAWKPLIQTRYSRNKPDAPKLASIFTAVPQGVGRWQIDFIPAGMVRGKQDGGYEGRLEIAISESDDPAAYSCVHALGFQYINGVMQDSGLHDPVRRQGLWLGSDYLGGIWGRDEATAGPRATASAVAEFLTLLVGGRLVSPAACGEMRATMALAGSWFNYSLTDNGRKASITYAKVGLWGGYYHDCIYVQRQAFDGQVLKYAAVGLHALSDRTLRELILQLDDYFVVNNAANH